MTVRPRWVRVKVDSGSFLMRIDWRGRMGYVTTYFRGLPLGIPVKCESVARAREISAARIRAYKAFLAMR